VWISAAQPLYTQFFVVEIVASIAVLSEFGRMLAVVDNGCMALRRGLDGSEVGDLELFDCFR
jgi:hypothetical protein